MPSSAANPGARPEGTASEGEAAQKVQAMFDSIAPRYDLLNHVLSLNIDRIWWWRTARRFRALLARPDARVLDICCGTGDMTMALLRHRPAGAVPVLAADFSHGMLVRGARKFTGRGAVAIEADAMRLPLADSSLDLLTTAFSSTGCSRLAVGSLSSTSLNPRACWAGCIASTFAASSRPSVRGFPARAARMLTCRPRSARFPRRWCCSGTCASSASRKPPGPPTASASPGCLSRQNRSPGMLPRPSPCRAGYPRAGRARRPRLRHGRLPHRSGFAASSLTTPFRAGKPSGILLRLTSVTFYKRACAKTSFPGLIAQAAAPHLQAS